MADKKSMLDYALEILQEKGKVSFSTLWNTVAKKAGLSEEEKTKKIAEFYSQLSLDGRFTAVGKDNKWSLSDRVEFDKRHVDLSHLDTEEASEDDSEEDEDENKSKSMSEDDIDEDCVSKVRKPSDVDSED